MHMSGIAIANRAGAKDMVETNGTAYMSGDRIVFASPHHLVRRVTAIIALLQEAVIYLQSTRPDSREQCPHLDAACLFAAASSSCLRIDGGNQAKSRGKPHFTSLPWDSSSFGARV